MIDLRVSLNLAIQAALEAGDVLRKGFRNTSTSNVDLEAEQIIRERLVGTIPESGYRGEEMGATLPSGCPRPRFFWLVDPNDGTTAYLEGARGSAVSIALVRDGEPVLGVVYAPLAPDDGGDLIAWADGCGPILHNGEPVVRPSWPDELGPGCVVLLSRHADRASLRNSAYVAPGRFRATPSIAYRLALAAVGEAEAAASVIDLAPWDYAAGHALVKAAGGVLVDGAGSAINYSFQSDAILPRCFAGSAKVVEALRGRAWEKIVGFPDPGHDTPPNLIRLESGESISDAGLLGRAQGCILGQLAGDNLGGLVEFRPASSIDREEIRWLRDGGQWDILAGQPTDDSEMALCLARSIIYSGGYESEAAAAMYRAWYASKPFDIGGTTRQALSAIRDADIAARTAAERAKSHANLASQANGSLMRISPLGIYAHALDPLAAADLAREESSLTHPNLVCQESCAVFTVAIALAISTGLDPDRLYAGVLSWAEASCRAVDVVHALSEAASLPPRSYSDHQGWVLTALQNAFYQLVHAPTLREGIVDTVSRGGDTDTNAAIAGALLGAVYGRNALPRQWTQMILTCRPVARLAGVRYPRPRFLWPVDALEIAERLLVAGRGCR